jgi:autotransporter passenger strand-loop-strand repeat protein
MTTYTISYNVSGVSYSYDYQTGDYVGTTVSYTGPVIGPFSVPSSDGGPDDIVWSDTDNAGDIAIGVAQEGTFYVEGESLNVTIGTFGDVIVTNGGSAVGTLINTDGYLDIDAGGFASGTTVNDLLEVYSGGLAAATTVNSGEMHLEGSATDTTVNNSGYLEIESGGIASGTTVSSGGTAYVYSGGEALNTTVADGGELFLEGGFIADPMTISAATDVEVASGVTLDGYSIISGVYWDILSGGAAMGTIIGSQGVELIESGGMASDTIISAGDQAIFAGGFVTNTTINDGSQSVGGLAVSTTINSSGTQYIESGGSASDTVINANSQVIASGGSVSETVISGGTQAIEPYGGNPNVVWQIDQGSATSTEVDLGCIQLAEYGGVASGTTVGSGGAQEIFSGSAVDTTINGGWQDVAEGSVTSTTLNSGGYQWITFGGSAANTIINDGSYQQIGSGSIALETTIGGGAYQTIQASGTAIDTAIEDGGLQYVSGLAEGTAIGDGGTEYVSAGGRTSGTDVFGDQYLLSGGSDISATIEDGGEQTVHGSAGGATILADGVQTVYAGGHDGSATVGDGGAQSVYGSADDATILAGGVQTVYSDGVASGTQVDGQQIVMAGATDDGSIIGDDGLQTIESGETVSGASLDSGGYQYVSGTAAGTTVYSGGVEVIESGGVASGVLVDGGTVELLGGSFSAAAFSGTLALPNGGAFSINAPNGLDVDFGGGATVTPQISIGLDASGASPVVTVENATVSYSDNSLTLAGTVYAALGGVSAPLFEGSFSLPDNGPTTSTLTDNGQFAGKLSLGGLNVSFEQLTLEDNALLAAFSLSLPFTGGSITLNTLPLGLNYGLSFNGAGEQIVWGGSAALPNLGPVNVFGIFQGSLSNASVSYLAATNTLELQGVFTASQILGSSLSATVDFSGNNFISWQAGTPEFAGNLSITGISTPTVAGKAAFGIKEIDLGVNTVAQTFSGGIQFYLPFGVSTPEADVSLKGNWVNGPVITEVDVSASNLGIVIPETPDLIWQSASLAVSNMFVDSAPTTFSGSLGFSFGPQIAGQNIGTLTLSGSASSQQLSASEQIQIVPYSFASSLTGGSLSGLQSIFPFLSETGTVTANFAPNGSGFENFEFDGTLGVFGNLITLNQSFKADANLDFTLAGSAAVNFGDSLFGKAINLGVQQNANYLVSYTNGAPLTSDFAEAWATTTASFIGLTSTFTIGVKADFDGDVSTLFGAPSATAAQSDAAIPALALNAAQPQIFGAPASSADSYLFITTSWTNAASGPVSLTVTDPNGNSTSEADFAANNIAVISVLSTAYSETVAVLNPSSVTGWSAQVDNPAGLGTITVSTAVPDAGPSLNSLSLTGVTSAQSLSLEYDVADTSGDSTLSFYADQDGQNFDGILLGTSASLADGSGTAGVSLADLGNGTWYIYGLIDDGVAEPQEVYASSTLTIVGNILTQQNADGSEIVSTFNITGEPYTSSTVSYGANGLLVSQLYSGVTGEGNLSSYEYLYTNGSLTGTDEFYAAITGQPYTFEKIDYNGAGQLTRAAFSGVSGQPYSSYEYDYAGGVFSGTQYTFTSVPQGASYSSYVVDQSPSNSFAGEQFFFTNLPGQPYTGEEEDFNSNVSLTRVVLTGVQNQTYSSLELDYAGGIYTGYKAYYTGLTGPYSSEEVDVSAANQLEKVVYSGLTGTPYSQVEQDYAGGSLADEIYSFTGVTGLPYTAYQVEDNAAGTALSETLDLASGGHDLIALASGQTLTSQGLDTMTGSASGGTAFVLNAIYGQDTITNLTAADTISMPTAEFANFNALLGAAQNQGANVVITAGDGDTLMLNNMTKAQLTGMAANFTFHG